MSHIPASAYRLIDDLEEAISLGRKLVFRDGDYPGFTVAQVIAVTHEVFKYKHRRAALN